MTKTFVDPLMADELVGLWDLPESWSWKAIGEVANVRLGKTPRKTDYRNGGLYKIIKFRDVNEDKIDLENDKDGFVVDEPKIIKSLVPLSTNDVLLTASAHSGESIGKKCAFVESLPDKYKYFFVGELLGVTSGPMMNPKWPFFYFLSRNGLRAVQKAITGVHLTGGRAKRIPIPLPPINDQNTIVQEVNVMLPRVRRAHERVERARIMIRKFRQAVLDAACSGELTKNWRTTSSTVGQWTEKVLGDVITDLGQGWSPKCEVQPSSSPEIWGVIKTTAIQPMFFSEVENKTLPKALAPRAQLEIHSGDLLITRAGPRNRAGICCLVRLVRPKLILCDKAYRFHAIEKHAIPDFIEVLLNAPKMLMELDKIKTGISDSGLNLTQAKFLSLPIALPDIAEQKEIVKRVRSYFEIADRVEVQLSKIENSCDQTISSVLAAAFEGIL